ncbi:unnamed protein product [Diamesa hyperborea]
MEKLIVVTGYGVFEGHLEKNASWECVKLLPNELEISGIKYKVIKKEIQVVYEDVNKEVDEIWKMNPSLVIHCGVHGSINKINLEKCAENGFCSSDFKKNCLPDPVVNLTRNKRCEILHTKINVDKIVKTLNSRQEQPMFEGSCNVGRYLCGYIYLKSLDVDPRKSLFVHVPCINKPFSSEETKDGLQEIIIQCIHQMIEYNQL